MREFIILEFVVSCVRLRGRGGGAGERGVLGNYLFFKQMLK